MSDLADLTQRIRAFRDARDWMQFHNPKNLACSIVLEAAELLEHFQWKTPEESEAYVNAPANKEQISTEIADVAVYLLELADNLGIDLHAAIVRKMAINEAKYPVEKSKGSSAKYTEL